MLEIREMMFGTGESFEYINCTGCGSLQIVLVPTRDELVRHYPRNYYSFKIIDGEDLKNRLSVLRDRGEFGLSSSPVAQILKKIRPESRMRLLNRVGIRPSMRILDVGCGRGELIDRLGRLGFTNIEGIDPFLIQNCWTPHGAKLSRASIRDLMGVEYDTIMFNHSLEHVPNPAESLSKARELLRRGGICLVRIPTTTSDAWRTYGKCWVQIDAPRHIVVPSRVGLIRAARAAGFHLQEVIDDSTRFQFVGSEAYMRGWVLSQSESRFSKDELREWDRRSDQLNEMGLGDQACFVFRAA